jgi:hypothetical protein
MAMIYRETIYSPNSFCKALVPNNFGAGSKIDYFKIRISFFCVKKYIFWLLKHNYYVDEKPSNLDGRYFFDGNT